MSGPVRACVLVSDFQIWEVCEVRADGCFVCCSRLACLFGCCFGVFRECVECRAGPVLKSFHSLALRIPDDARHARRHHAES